MITFLARHVRASLAALRWNFCSYFHTVFFFSFSVQKAQADVHTITMILGMDVNHWWNDVILRMWLADLWITYLVDLLKEGVCNLTSCSLQER